MNTNYDTQIEEIWRDLAKQGQQSCSQRFVGVMAKFPNMNRKYKGVFVSCLVQRCYTCICSKEVDCYFIVGDNTTQLRIGKECIGKLLKGEELKQAEKEMKEAEIKEKELRRINYKRMPKMELSI